MFNHNLHRVTLFSLLFLICGGTQAANISLNTSDWEYTDYSLQAPSSLTNTGNLRGTLLEGRPGGWGMEVQTVDTFNFQDATLRFKWRMNGLGQYSALVTTINDDALERVANYVASDGASAYFTTHNSWAGSQLVSDDQWMYTEILYEQGGATFSVSADGYGVSPLSSGTFNITTARWDALSDAHFRFLLLDNRIGGQYFEIGEAMLNSSAVPVPAAVWLFGSGLVGLIGFGRRKMVAA